jgi:hypothetical protein
MIAIKQLNLLVSFLLELVMLYLYGYWAFGMREPMAMKYLLAIVVPFLVIVLWLIWAAPKSKHRLKNPFRSIFKLSLFLIATLACFKAGQPAWAIWFGAVTLVNVVLAFMLKQDY